MRTVVVVGPIPKNHLIALLDLNYILLRITCAVSETSLWLSTSSEYLVKGCDGMSFCVLEVVVVVGH